MKIMQFLYKQLAQSVLHCATVPKRQQTETAMREEHSEVDFVDGRYTCIGI